MDRERVENQISGFELLGLLRNGKKYYLDFDQDEWFVPLTMWNDYCGTTVERSNYLEMIERFDFLRDRGLSYGGAVVCFVVEDVMELSEEEECQWEEFVEELYGLNEYPVLNEQALFELEMELEGEAWDAFYRDEFISEIDARGWLTEDQLEIMSGLDSFQVFELCRRLMERANVYFMHETATSPYLDIEKIVDAITSDDINEFMPEYEPEPELNIDSFIPPYEREV